MFPEPHQLTKAFRGIFRGLGVFLAVFRVDSGEPFSNSEDLSRMDCYVGSLA